MGEAQLSATLHQRFVMFERFVTLHVGPASDPENAARRPAPQCPECPLPAAGDRGKRRAKMDPRHGPTQCQTAASALSFVILYQHQDLSVCCRVAHTAYKVYTLGTAHTRVSHEHSVSHLF